MRLQYNVDVRQVMADYGISQSDIVKKSKELQDAGKVRRFLTHSQLSKFLSGSRDLNTQTTEVLELCLYEIEPAAAKDLLNRRRLRFDGL